LKLIPSHVLRFDGELIGIVGFALLAVWWVTGAGVLLIAYLSAFSLLGYFR